MFDLMCVLEPFGGTARLMLGMFLTIATGQMIIRWVFGRDDFLAIDFLKYPKPIDLTRFANMLCEFLRK